MTETPETRPSVVTWKKFHHICGSLISVARELMLPYDAVVRERRTPDIDPPQFFFGQKHGIYIPAHQQHKMVYLPAVREGDEQTADLLFVQWFDGDFSVIRERLVFRRSHDLPMPWIVAARTGEEAVFGFCADGEEQKRDNRFLQLKFWSKEECARDCREPFLPVFFKIIVSSPASVYSNTMYFRVSAERVESENSGLHDIFVHAEFLDNIPSDVPEHLLAAKPPLNWDFFR